MLYNRENPLNCGKIFKKDPLHAQFFRKHFVHIIHKRESYGVFSPQCPEVKQLFDVICYSQQQHESLAQDHMLGIRSLFVNGTTPLKVLQEFLDTSQASFVLVVRQCDDFGLNEDINLMMKYMRQTKATLGFVSVPDKYDRALATVPHVTLTQTIQAWQFCNPPSGLENPFSILNFVCHTNHLKRLVSSSEGSVMVDLIQQWEEQKINPENICLFQLSNQKES